MLNSKFDINSPEWIDRVFENRNKSYGAYDLRKNSSRSMVRALSIVILSMAAIVGVSSFLMGRPPESVNTKKDGTVAVLNTDVTVTHEAKKGVKRNDIPATATTGSPTVIEGRRETSRGGELIESKDANVKPVLVGGAQTWARFLEANLHYPAEARAKHVTGSVWTSFIVERDGSLTDIKVEQSAGYGFDEEAVRVLKLSPRWMPGKQNGQTIRVKYSLPINFNIEFR